MKTIIIPTDFSDIANNAMEYGIEMARSVQASVLLLHIYQVPMAISDTPVVLVSIDELKMNAETRLHELKNQLQAQNPDIKFYSEAKLGNVIDEIETVCNNISPIAVVVGSKGTTGLEQVMFGSNTLSMIRTLRWPIICVPQQRKFGSGIKKIGFACDFKKVVETTPAHAIVEFVKFFHSELHVLNIDYHNRHFNADTPQESLLLQTLLDTVNPVYHFIESKNVVDGLDSFATRNEIDLLIAIPKKHSLLEGFFRGSQTRQLVFHSHVPVMCIHED